MHIYDDEIEREAVHPGNDRTSSVDEHEDEMSGEPVDENENKNEQQEAGDVLTTGGSGFERCSPRQELLSLVEEEIAAARDEQEKQALQIAKEEILRALDEAKGGRK